MGVRRIGACLASLLALVLLVGCGNSNLGQVSGTVTLDGEPLADATLIFTPRTGGRPAAGRTDSQGRYELIFDRNSAGAQLGEHVVEITTADEIANDDDTVETIPEKVPAKYNFNTELTATIEAGSNVFDFPLESGDEIIEGQQAEDSASENE